MAGALVPIANVWQFFTNAGAILAGGKLYTYAAGTSTPLTTYTTKALSVQNANPIVLDSYGRLPNGVFVEAGTSCKLILHDSAGNQLGPTFDNLDAVGGSGAGSSSQFWGGTAGGTPNALTINPSGYTANTAGNVIQFIAASDNTGAVTLNVASLGNVNVQKQGSTALASGDIQANAVVCVVFDGTKFQLESTSDFVAQLARNVPAGNIAATDVQTAINELDTEKGGLALNNAWTGTQDFQGTVTLTSKAINMAQGSALSDSGTPDLGAVAGNYVHADAGTTTWTALGTVQAGTFRIVKFGTARQITHNATSLILPGAANITTANGDVAGFVSLGSGNWRCVWFSRTSGDQGLASGRIIQVARTLYSTVFDTAGTALPLDTSIPQNTEGDEITGLATTITPKYTNSKLLVECSVQCGDSASAADYVIAALFRDSTANAIASGLGDFEQTSNLEVCAEVTASALTATTFKVRIGTNGGSVVRVNAKHDNATIQLGATVTSIMKVTEIAA